MKNQKLCESLQKIIKGTTSDEKEFLEYYSVDASSYQIIPHAIVFPDNIQDIIKVIKFAKKNNIAVTPRGGGTGLVGNSLNEGIIIDMKNFNRVSVSKNSITVEPGVTKGKLDQVLYKKKKFFGPNPSIGAYCTIGGMLGNNSSGSHTIKYGSVLDNLLEVIIVDGNGKLVTLPKNKKLSNKILKIHKQINWKKIPKVTKNSCGYRLDSIKSIKDSAKIIAASEGTLGIIVSAKLKIYDIPKNRILIILEYTNVKNAAKDCYQILKTNPSALEFVDKNTLKNIKFSFDKKAICLLFVEYDSKIKQKLEKITSGKIVKILKNKSDITKWWRYRDSSLHYSLKSIQNDKRIPHVIEDAVVPIENLPELFILIKKINHKFKTNSVFYGHAGNGNIHVRLISKRKKPIILKDIAITYFNEIMKLGGSITGEHGDGLARSEFVKKQYGVKNYQLFKELKCLFDSKNIMNPGKIISKNSTLIRNLEKL